MISPADPIERLAAGERPESFSVEEIDAIPTDGSSGMLVAKELGYFKPVLEVRWEGKRPARYLRWTLPTGHTAYWREDVLQRMGELGMIQRGSTDLSRTIPLPPTDSSTDKDTNDA